MRSCIYRFSVIASLSIGLALGVSFPVLAQSSADLGSDPVAWQKELDRATGLVEGDTSAPRRFEDLRQRLIRTEAEAQETIVKDTVALEKAKTLLQSLGPVPEAGRTPEAPEIVGERERINQQIDHLQTRIRLADYTIARAGSLRSIMLANDRQRMTRELLASGPKPFQKELWVSAGNAVGPFVSAVFGRPFRAIVSFFSEAEALPTAGGFLILVGALTISLMLRVWSRRRQFYPHFDDLKPSYSRRLLVAGLRALAQGSLPAFIGLGFYAALFVVKWNDDSALLGLVNAISIGLTSALFLNGFFAAALSTTAPAWRLFQIPDRAAEGLNRTRPFFICFVAVAVFASCLFDFWDRIDPSIEQLTVLLLVTCHTFLVWQITRRLHWPTAVETGTASAGTKLVIRLSIRFAVLVSFGAVLAGYYELSAYLATSISISGLSIGLFALLRRSVREGLPLIFTAKGRRALQFRIRFGLEEEDAARTAFWLGAILQVGLFVLLILVLLIAWRIPEYNVDDFGRRIVAGFKFGNTTIRPGDIGVAVAVFFLALFVTRGIKRTLRERVLPQTTLNRGLRDSISTGIGYVGIVIALILGVTSLGVDLSNVALIASALSVGIGFGLQSIVNNFISGIILLIERPLKVGDWVIIGNNEGFVRRISVRSTEIETSRQSSAIIPNAEILSHAVVNLTHNDKKGRVEVTIGVDYNSDPEKVRDLLLNCARNHPNIDTYPAPQVLFKDFGADALIFQVRGFVLNIETRMQVESDLRFSINQVFRDAKIRIPGAQREIQFPDFERLATLFSRNNPTQ